MLKKFNALIVDPDIAARSRLKEVLKIIALKTIIAVCKNVKEASNKISAVGPFDAIFISSSFDKDKIPEVLKTLRSDSKGTPLVMVLKTKDLESSFVATLFLNGASGFICEPFSADAVLEHLETIQDTVKSNTDNTEKIKSTLSFLVADAMSYIDKVADQLASGNSGGYAMKSLRNIGEQIKNTSSQISDGGLEIVVENLLKAKLPKQKAGAKLKQKAERSPHPGEVLSQMIADRGITIQRLSASMGIDPATIESLAKQQIPLDSELADKISRSLGETPSFWLGLQRKWEQQEAKKKQKSSL